jgi:hypothetical protein
VEEASCLAHEGSVLVFTGEAQGDLEAAIQHGRDERSRKLAGFSTPPSWLRRWSGPIPSTIALSPSDYTQTLQRASQMGLAGGIIFDALIARAAEIAEADELLTFNLKDFQRVSPEGAFILRVP